MQEHLPPWAPQPGPGLWPEALDLVRKADRLLDKLDRAAAAAGDFFASAGWWAGTGALALVVFVLAVLLIVLVFRGK